MGGGYSVGKRIEVIELVFFFRFNKIELIF